MTGTCHLHVAKCQWIFKMDLFTKRSILMSDQIQFREGSELDSDTGSEPERYDRRTQLNEHYQEKLGSDQEDDDDEETIDGKTLRLLVLDDAVAQTSVSSHRDRGRLLDAPRRFGRVFSPTATASLTTWPVGSRRRTRRG